MTHLAEKRIDARRRQMRRVTHARPDDEPALCEHGYPKGRGCAECEFWERGDYERDRIMDR
jgi:hypothetical protein